MPPDQVFKAFFPGNEQIVCETFGTGHIHETFLISLPNNGEQYILQKINHSIFKQVDLLQENIEKITAHIRKELMKKAGSDSEKQAIEVFKTNDGKAYFQDENQEFWRCFYFIPKSKTYDQISNPDLAYQAGKALGEFIKLLDNFPLGLLHITLPNFHNLDFRLEQFNESIEKNLTGRKTEIEDEIIFVQNKARKLIELLEMEHKKGIPLRVTHNDPKINNVLFDENDKAVCMIDLDTVMPGYIYHDFGDAIRTGAASAKEDEPDTSKMFVKLDLFEAYAKGFLAETLPILTKTELSILSFAPQLMTFIIGLRFLTDYVNGDVYFKIHHKKHNLERWFAQKALFTSMEENEQIMKQIIHNIETK